MTISAKVAHIVDDRQIAITAGSKQGVKMGDSVKLVERTQVTDPDSGDDLGTFLTVRLQMRVSLVSDKFALARTFTSVLVRTASGRRTEFHRITSNRAEANAGTTYVAVGMPVLVESPPPVEAPEPSEGEEADLDDLPF